jgi:DMSO/TMAO reductase YedYZ heme-binding membrane subunit
MKMDILKKIILDGQIPYFRIIKKGLFVLAILIPFFIFLSPMSQKDFANIGWIVLICVMSVRPVSQIFPDFGVFRALYMLRREFGIFAGLMIFSHFIGYLLLAHVSIFSIFTKSVYWNVNGYFFWGIVGLLFMIPVFITSNKTAMLFLKKYWRYIQKLAYLFLLFGGIHIILVGKDIGLTGLIIVAVLWILAAMKVKIKFLNRGV